MDISDCYNYPAKVVSVYDGDTITVNIDLGYKVHMDGVKVRLDRIDAPEVRGASRPDGLVSRDWMRGRVLGKEVIIHSSRFKHGKYGRLIADIYHEGICLNDEMVTLGLAVYKKY